MKTDYEHLVDAAKTVGWSEDASLSDQQFMKSLLKAVSKTSDEVWKSLPQHVSKWFDNAAIANNTPPHVVPYPEGFVGKEKHEEPKKEEKKVKTINAPTPTKAKSTKVSGVIDVIRKTLILHPEWSNAEVHKHVQGQGFQSLKIETVQVNAGDVRRTVAIIKELGFWKEDQPPALNKDLESKQEVQDADKQKEPEEAGKSETVTQQAEV